MKLYEISPQIEEIMSNGTVDETTGEYIFDQDAVDSLGIEFNVKMESLLLHGKNVLADAEAIKAEKDALDKRYKAKLAEANRCYEYAKFCLNGNAFETPKVKVSYSKAVSTEVSRDFVGWAIEKGRNDLLTYSNPTANKTAIKKALQEGEHIPFANLVTGKMQVK